MSEHDPSVYEADERLRKAVIYVRVSSLKQKSDGDGLRSQERVCRDYARYKGLRPIRVFSDAMTGSVAARPGMEEMLRFLRKHKRENMACVIDDISRLARDYITHMTLRAEIREAGGELLSPSIEFSDDPTAQFPEKLRALVVEEERINNAKRSASRMRARMQGGFWPLREPNGYAFEKGGRGVGGKVLVRVEPVASILAEALERFATGELGSQMEVKRFLDRHPAFPKNRHGEVHKQKIKKLLSNPLYAGYICYPEWDIPLTKAHHEPLISLATHEKVLERLSGRSISIPVRQTINPAFPLRGFICCADCSVPYKASFSRGRSNTYGYYVCQTKSCDSYGRSVRKEKLEKEFDDLLQTVRPDETLVRIASRLFKSVWEKNIKDFHARRRAALDAAKAVEKKIEGLVDRILESSQPRMIAVYEKEMDRLEKQRVRTLDDAERFARENGGAEPNFETAYRTAIAFLSNPCIYWRSGRINEQRAVLKLTFADRLQYCRKTGYRTAPISLPFRVLSQLQNVESSLVPRAGLEPALCCQKRILSPPRLPIPPPGQAGN